MIMTLLNVKYKVTVAGKTFYPWEHEVEGEELKALKVAPYVTAVKKAKTPAKAAAKVTGDDAGDDTGDAGDTGAGDAGENAGDDADDTIMTQEDYEAMDEADLREYYTQVQTAAGKTAPTNIKVETIIANLLK